MKSMLRLFASLVILLCATDVLAEIIELETAEKRISQATFLQGDNDASPLLILHGFLQTREFSTVNRLVNSLNESGYTVLAPTLTLGISRRKQSLACEAIHTHSVEKDTAEIAQWIGDMSNTFSFTESSKAQFQAYPRIGGEAESPPGIHPRTIAFRN